jgi:hypothetical protein
LGSGKLIKNKIGECPWFSGNIFVPASGVVDMFGGESWQETATIK